MRISNENERDDVKKTMVQGLGRAFGFVVVTGWWWSRGKGGSE